MCMKNAYINLITFTVLIFNLPVFAGAGKKYSYHVCPTVAEAATAINGGRTVNGTLTGINGVQYKVYSKRTTILTTSHEQTNNFRSGRSIFTGAVHTITTQPQQSNQIECNYQIPDANFSSNNQGYIATLVTDPNAKQCVHRISPSVANGWTVFNLLAQTWNGPSMTQANCNSNNNPSSCPFKCR